jgi:ribosome maturation factor RimP
MEKNIEKLVENALNGGQIRLIEIEIRGEKKNKIIEVYLDSPGNLNLDELTEVTRKINSLIDESEIRSELLKVVVSSPGVERPFRYIWQVEKHIGREFEFGNTDEIKTGKLTGINGDILSFEVKAGKKEIREETAKFSELEILKVKLPF